MFKQVKEFLLPYIEIDAGDVKLDTALSELGIDSIKLFEIVANFETKFGVKISDKQLGELFTVQDLVNIAEQAKKQDK